MKRFTSYAHMAQDELNQEVWDACYRGDLEQLKYALHSPDLKIHGNIYYDNGDCFFWAYTQKHTDVVNYLLYEEKYVFTDNLKNNWQSFIPASPSSREFSSLDEIKDVFEKRDLYFQLKDLPSKSSKKGIKI